MEGKAMENTVDKSINKFCSMETIDGIVNNSNCRYLLGGVFVCYLVNRIIDARYVFESTIDINTKILKFNIMPIKAD